jgi:hypothetical protein
MTSARPALNARRVSELLMLALLDLGIRIQDYRRASARRARQRRTAATPGPVAQELDGESFPEQDL